MCHRYVAIGIALILFKPLLAQKINTNPIAIIRSPSDPEPQTFPFPPDSVFTGLPGTLTALLPGQTTIPTTSSASSIPTCGPRNVSIPFPTQGFPESFLNVTIDNITYPMIIDINLDGFFLFSNGLCVDDPSDKFLCIEPSSSTVFADSIEPTSVFTYNRNVSVSITGVDIVLPDMEVSAIDQTHLLDPVQSNFAKGIIGVNSNSSFVQAIMLQCNTNKGHGVYIGDGSQGGLVVGGYDGNKFDLGNATPTTAQHNDIWSLQIQNVAVHNSTAPNKSSNVNTSFVVIIDSLAQKNTIDSTLMDKWFPQNSADDTHWIAFYLQEGEEPINMTDTLGPLKSHFERTDNTSKMVFGKPFLQAAYFASLPSGEIILGSINQDSTLDTSIIVSSFPASTSSSIPKGTGTSVVSVASIPTSSTVVHYIPHQSSHIGAIVGGIIGGVVFVLLVLALCLFCRRRRRQSRGRGIDNTTSRSALKKEDASSPYAPIPPPAPYQYNQGVNDVQGVNQDSRMKLMNESPIEQEVRHSEEDDDDEEEEEEQPQEYQQEYQQQQQSEQQPQPQHQRGVIQDPRTDGVSMFSASTLRSPSPDLASQASYRNTSPEIIQSRNMAPRLPFNRTVGGGDDGAL